MARSTEIRIEKWGNSLAVRIPASVARRAGFHAGQPVKVSLQDSSVLVAPAAWDDLTLEQKLARFDPLSHGGELMQSERIGPERVLMPPQDWSCDRRDRV